MTRLLFIATHFLYAASVLSFAPSRPAFTPTGSSTTTTQLQGFGLGMLFGGSTGQLATKAQVQHALQDPRAVLVDARSLDEIKQTGYLKSRAHRRHHQWIHAPGSPFENPVLELAAEDMIPDKAAPVLIYCASGKRAARAKHVLDDKGFQMVLNLGGYDEAKSLMKQ